jgi:hypothetical protein
MKNWFKFPGEFVPSESLKEHVFSRASAKKAIARLASVTDTLLANRPVDGAAGNTGGPGVADLDDLGEASPTASDPGLDDFDLDGLD